jgi:uracil-DNA glycosylase family 4
MEISDPVSALHQQLRADFLFGLRFLPMTSDALDALARLGEPQCQSAVTSPNVSAASTPVAKSSSDIATRQLRLRTLDETQVRGCRKCVLCESRTQTVFGQGSATARLIFVGEGPGFEEDKQGLAFVGAAGQLLTKMIGAMGLTRDEVYICNVVKCRPPGNRTPTPEEIQACNPYLREQLETIAPEVIVSLGAPASQTLLNTGIPIGRLRGRFHDYYLSGQPGVGPAVPVMPTYHPAYLLRTPGDKGKTWDDLKQVMAALNLEPTKSS